MFCHFAARSRLDAGEALDAATLCDLIKEGEKTMADQQWKAVLDRYYTPEDRAHWAVKKAEFAAATPGFDQDAYTRDWVALDERIRAALLAALAPAVVEIVDDSARHAGHAGARPGGETHYTVLAVSPRFAGLSRVARHRLVHEALEGEFGAGLHALALVLRAPGEGN